MLLSSGGIECSISWKIIWSLTTIIGIGLPIIFIKHIKNITAENIAKLKTKLNLVNLLELVLAFYFAFGVLKGIQLKDYGLLPFHLMLAIGFLIVFYYSFKQSFASNK